MTRTLGQSVAEFEGRYVRKVGIRKSLIEYANGDCVFFDNKARNCSVYPARPSQCRTWPFWDSNLETPADWKWVQSVCPGSRSGNGQLYTLGEIRKRADVVSL